MVRIVWCDRVWALGRVCEAIGRRLAEVLAGRRFLGGVASHSMLPFLRGYPPGVPLVSKYSI